MKIVSRTSKTFTLVAAGVVGAAAAAYLLAPEPASAFPAYAQKTGQHCAYCHINPKGGGGLNKFGQKWVMQGMKGKPKK